MSTEINKSEPKRSGFAFDKREKAYHVYMYTLQNRNYGISVSEYVKQHNLIYGTFRGWLKFYPQGKPYYDADSVVVSEAFPKRECQMIKLSSEQLVPKKDNEITEIRRSFCSSASVMIKFYDSVISANSDNIALILSAIKNVSNDQDL